MKRSKACAGMLFPAVKPDHDNLIKSTQDCFERAGIIKNDSRIVWCTARKVFADTEGTEEGTHLRLGTIYEPSGDTHDTESSHV